MKLKTHKTVRLALGAALASSFLFAFGALAVLAFAALLLGEPPAGLPFPTKSVVTFSALMGLAASSALLPFLYYSEWINSIESALAVEAR